MRYLMFFAALGAGLAADPVEIVRRSIEVYQGENEQRAFGYRYTESAQSRKLDDNGGVKSTTSKTHEIFMIEGTPYRRLLAQDGKPVPPDEQERQRLSLRHNIELRRNETPEDRRKRLEEWQKRRDKYKKSVAEIPDAFVFRLAGEETVNGRPVWVIEAEPRPNYRPVDRYSKLYTQLKGRIWIDQQDYHWARVEAELLDTVSFGWILVRIGKGARVKLDNVRLDGGVWVPGRLWYTVAARIGLLKTYHVEQENQYTGYQKQENLDQLLARLEQTP